MKSKVGLGKRLAFTFTAPCFKKTESGDYVACYDGEIEFNYKQFGNDDQSLMGTNPIMYCLKVCHKIGFYMLKMHEIELMRMKVEFY